MRGEVLLRAVPLLGMMLLGCDGGPASGVGAMRVECAIGKNGGWARNCPVERAGDMLTLRHPDGGFRRFRIVHDGRGLIAADGAEQGKLAIMDKGRIELAVGDDRYRLPATIAQGAR